MAVEYIEAVYHLPDLTTSEVCVLGYLANKANETGSCWPSRTTIAAACRLHPDTVKTILQGLASRGLIGKEGRFFEGRQTSNRIVLKFDPAYRASNSRGETPPGGGVYDPRGPGVDHPRGPGAGDPPHEPSEEPSEDSVARWASRIWDETPIESRRKSTTKAQLTEALRSARKRGHDLARVAEALRRYFDDPEHRRDKCRAMKGVHRVVQNDLWETWAPPADWTPPAPREPGAPPPADDMGTMQAPGLVVQEVWMQDYVDAPYKWQSHVRGPEPGTEGCRISDEVQRRFGVEPYKAAAE